MMQIVVIIQPGPTFLHTKRWGCQYISTKDGGMLDISVVAHINGELKLSSYICAWPPLPLF